MSFIVHMTQIYSILKTNDFWKHNSFHFLYINRGWKKFRALRFCTVISSLFAITMELSFLEFSKYSTSDWLKSLWKFRNSPTGKTAHSSYIWYLLNYSMLESVTIIQIRRLMTWCPPSALFSALTFHRSITQVLSTIRTIPGSFTLSYVKLDRGVLFGFFYL